MVHLIIKMVILITTLVSVAQLWIIISYHGTFSKGMVTIIVDITEVRTVNIKENMVMPMLAMHTKKIADNYLTDLMAH